MSTAGDRCDVLAQIDAAAGDHQNWVAQVRVNPIASVPLAATECAFGQWLESTREAMAEVAEFEAVDRAHQQLHDTYALIKHTPEQDRVDLEIGHHSRELISCLQRLRARIAGTN